jgi:glycosyltransferase
VVNQTYDNIEYIIVDGASTDGSIELIKDFQKVHDNIKLISEPDHGIYDALNKGIRHATGDIIGFIHADDMLASNCVISNIIENFKNDNIAGVYGDLHYITTEEPFKIIRNWKSEPFRPKLLRQGWMPAHPTLFLKKTIFERYGNFKLDYRIAADYDFMLRIFKDSTLTFKYLPEVITKMRVGGASNKSLKNLVQKTKEDYRAVRSNNIGGWYLIFLKNISKVRQFIFKS